MRRGLKMQNENDLKNQIDFHLNEAAKLKKILEKKDLSLYKNSIRALEITFQIEDNEKNKFFHKSFSFYKSEIKDFFDLIESLK